MTRFIISLLLLFFQGYIKQQVSEMAVMCEATFVTDSSLECSKYLRWVLTLI